MEKYEYPAEEKAVLEGMQIPFAIYQFVDKRVVTLIISDGFCDLFGYADKKDAYYDMDHSMYKYNHPDDAVRISEEAFRFAGSDGKYDVTYRTRKRNDDAYSFIHAVGVHFYTETGVRLAQVWYTDEGVYDAETSSGRRSRSEEIALHEDKIFRTYYYDQLTGLPTMTYFFEIAEAWKASLNEQENKAVLLFFDLMGMKYFNTSNGFSEGDKLLRAMTEVLTDFFGADHCCRAAADHFIALTLQDDLEAVLNKLFARCAEMNGGKSLPVHVGIYPNCMEDVPVTTAFDRAKLTCDTLHSTYHSCFRYYTNDLREEAIKREYILSNLDRALEEHWIELYNQPIVRAVTGRVSDEEGLARWNDPVRGMLSPADFIPILEDAGQIYKLDLYMLDRVLEKICVLKEHGLYIVPQSINLSRSDFDSCDIVEEVRKRVDAAGIGHDKITIEITESVIGRDIDFMKEQIERFQKLGFGVWMDDFGSGYSSLNVLQTIRFDLLKFDMSFMKKLDEGGDGKIILTELMRLATALGVDTLCEGVETREQARFLQEIGCSKLQGYYFTKPLSLPQVLERYKKGIQIGFENPDESGYFETIGRINLYDLTVIADTRDSEFHNFFNIVPMGIIEICDNKIRITRSNNSFREFVNRFFQFDLSKKNEVTNNEDIPFATLFLNLMDRCCTSGNREFLDEQLADGSTIHSFAKRVGINAVTGTTAIAVAILSITSPGEGTTYSNIARALAADYIRIYYVDLESGRFIEYSLPSGAEEVAAERRGTGFFDSIGREIAEQVYEADREEFCRRFTKEEILQELGTRGVATRSYRVVEGGMPVYVTMKITRVRADERYLIIGISAANVCDLQDH